jgi:hypothetical protein
VHWPLSAPGRRLPLLPSVAAALLLLSGCVTPIQRPADCGAASVERTATLTGARRLEPQTIAVCRDQAVTINVEVQTDGVLHVHGYDDQMTAVVVTAGSPVTLSFDAVHSGQFVIELHTSDGPTETGAGILTVDEP